MRRLIILIDHITKCEAKLVGTMTHKSKRMVNYIYFITIQTAVQKKFKSCHGTSCYNNGIGLITLATETGKIFTATTFK